MTSTPPGAGDQVPPPAVRAAAEVLLAELTERIAGYDFPAWNTARRDATDLAWALHRAELLIDAETTQLRLVAQTLFTAQRELRMDTDADEDLRLRLLATCVEACPWLETIPSERRSDPDVTVSGPTPRRTS